MKRSYNVDRWIVFVLTFIGLALCKYLLGNEVLLLLVATVLVADSICHNALLGMFLKWRSYVRQGNICENNQQPEAKR